MRRAITTTSAILLSLLLLISCATMATTLNGRRIVIQKSGKDASWLYELEKYRAMKYFKGGDKVLCYLDDAHRVLSGKHYFNDVPFAGGFEDGTLVLETSLVCRDDAVVLYIEISEAYSLYDNSYRVHVPETYISDRMVDALLQPFLEYFSLVEVPPRDSDATIDKFQILSRTSEQ